MTTAPISRALWTPQGGGTFLAATRLLTAAVVDAQKGEFEAVITVFGEPDSLGRIIEAGAFDEGLDAHGWPAVVWTHLWDQTPIGVTTSLTVDGDRLVATGRLFTGDRAEGGDDFGSTLAKDIWRSITTPGGDGKPALRDVSIGCFIREDPKEVQRADGGSYWVFSRLDLVEWGPCLRGAHPLAKITQTAGDATPPQPIVSAEPGGEDPGAAADVATDEVDGGEVAGPVGLTAAQAALLARVLL